MEAPVAVQPAPSAAGLHLLIVDPLFHDATRPGPTRGYDLAARFRAAGHRVSALTTTAGIDAGEGRGAWTATMGGVALRALRLPRAQGWHLPPGAAARFAGWAFRALWRFQDVDAVVVAGPWRLVTGAALFAWIRAIPLIADVRAVPPPPVPAGTALGPRLRAGLGAIGRRLCLMLPQRVLVASPTIDAAMTALGLTDARRIKLPMGSDQTLLSLAAGADNALLAETPELVGRPIVLWAGPFTADRDVAALVDLAAALQEVAPLATLVLCGDGPTRPEIIRLIHARQLPESALRLIGPLPRARMREALAAATVVLALPGPNDLASDFFDGLAAGKPVVYLGDGWQRALLESRSAGFGISPGDIAGAAREIAELLRDADSLRRTGLQASALAATRFNLDRLLAETRTAIEGVVAAAPRHAILRRRTLFWKRAIDIAVAATVLVALAPIGLALAILIAFKLGTPVLAAQARTGLRGRTFKLLKFRTLTDAEDPTGALLAETERVTPLGRFLKRTALDELPSLINVLIGDVSLVGPRALPAAYAPYYDAAQKRRHEVRPGLTGLAQVDAHGQSWEEKFVRDLAYVDQLSLGLDLRIILRTIGILLRGRRLDPQHAVPRFDEIMARREGAEDA